MWFSADKPLMRHKNMGDMTLIMLVLSKTLSAGLREMIQSPDGELKGTR
jgi:hypothetical protein